MKNLDKTTSEVVSFKDIQPNEFGQGLSYVVDTKYGTTKTSKPFFTLYLRDMNDIVLPAYVFDIDDYISAGIDLKRCKGNVVSIKYQENFLMGYGMTLILREVSLCKDIPNELLEQLVGRCEDIEEDIEYISRVMKDTLGVSVTLPRQDLLKPYVEFSGGKIGGLLKHYAIMLKHLESYRQIMSEKEYHDLIGTAVLFIFTYTSISRENTVASVNLLARLSTKSVDIAKRIGLTGGFLEVIHCQFNFQPRDIYTRIVVSTFDNVKKVSNELQVWRALPYEAEGNAGYGTILKYREDS